MLASSSKSFWCQEVENRSPMSTTVAPALRALLEHLIDYAGVFPPAALTIDAAVANYCKYRNESNAWMLRSFVIGAADIQRLPKSLSGCLAVLSEEDDIRAASIESKGIV